MKGAMFSAALSNEKVRRGIGWLLATVLSPAILLIVFLCSLAAGSAEHNNLAVGACFYGTSYSEEVPAEYQDHITEMRSAFSLLDSAVATANGQMDSGDGLDPVWVKAVFYSRRAANRFVECFYTTETRTRTVTITNADGTVTTEEESYIVSVPLPMGSAYANLSRLLEEEITEDDQGNVEHIYAMIAGPVGGNTYDGSYQRGDDPSIDLDISKFIDSATKNASDLVTYAIHAWESGWGYVWGTFGGVLTDGLFQSKLAQYPEGVGKYEDFIREHWVGCRTTDCVGLIKGYGWLDPDTLTIEYATNGMPDFSANQMYYCASESGTIDTIPEIPGLAVWCDGHIGVYIGNGEVIESMGTKHGVVKTQLEGRGWTHWLKVAFINYD